jgi:uncharacterized repeat protein (TIGR01451 family)
LSRPNYTIERCGDPSNWTPGIRNAFYADDLSPVIDISCFEVGSSYDPNDKAASPRGLGDDHYILPNEPLNYTIRFQNTGNDTAFTVVIRDTLDMDLDIFFSETRTFKSSVFIQDVWTESAGVGIPKHSVA